MSNLTQQTGTPCIGLESGQKQTGLPSILFGENLNSSQLLPPVVSSTLTNFRSVFLRESVSALFLQEVLAESAGVVREAL